jgi:hypothetical protein
MLLALFVVQGCATYVSPDEVNALLAVSGGPALHHVSRSPDSAPDTEIFTGYEQPWSIAPDLCRSRLWTLELSTDEPVRSVLSQQSSGVLAPHPCAQWRPQDAVPIEGEPDDPTLLQTLRAVLDFAAAGRTSDPGTEIRFSDDRSQAQLRNVQLVNLRHVRFSDTGERANVAFAIGEDPALQGYLDFSLDFVQGRVAAISVATEEVITFY